MVQQTPVIECESMKNCASLCSTQRSWDTKGIYYTHVMYLNKGRHWEKQEPKRRKRMLLNTKTCTILMTRDAPTMQQHCCWKQWHCRCSHSKGTLWPKVNGNVGSHRKHVTNSGYGNPSAHVAIYTAVRLAVHNGMAVYMCGGATVWSSLLSCIS